MKKAECRHGIFDHAGCRTWRSGSGSVYKGRQEKNDNLKLALAVGEILKNKGINISYTRTGDVYQTPLEGTA